MKMKKEKYDDKGMKETCLNCGKSSCALAGKGNVAKVNENDGCWIPQEKVFYVAPDIILRMIINDKENMLDMFKENKKTKTFNVVTSAFCFYEAISCMTKEEIIENVDKIIDAFKSIPIGDLKKLSGKYYVEDKKRKEHLREIALRPIEKSEDVNYVG
jgi:hypothetical protein